MQFNTRVLQFSIPSPAAKLRVALNSLVAKRFNQTKGCILLVKIQILNLPTYFELDQNDCFELDLQTINQFKIT